MTDRPTVTEVVAPFTITCSRCRGVQVCASVTEMGVAMYDCQELGGNILCAECSAIINKIRNPFLTDAYAAAVNEINQYHADNPVGSAPPVLTVVDKGGGALDGY